MQELILELQLELLEQNPSISYDYQKYLLRFHQAFCRLPTDKELKTYCDIRSELKHIKNIYFLPAQKYMINCYNDSGTITKLEGQMYSSSSLHIPSWIDCIKKEQISNHKANIIIGFAVSDTIFYDVCYAENILTLNPLYE